MAGRAYYLLIMAMAFLTLANSPSPKHPVATKSVVGSDLASLASSGAIVPYTYRCDAPRDSGELAACAAADQAKAAEKANAIALDSLWWNRLGIGAVVATLIATAWAAWAAARASNMAALSVDQYRDTEAADLVPNYNLHYPGSVQIRLMNVGRSRAHVLYADVGLIPDGEVAPLVFTMGTHQDDLVVTPDGYYDFGTKQFPVRRGTVGGGAIYRDIFGRMKMCTFAFGFDLEAAKFTRSENIDFRKWQTALRRFERKRWWRRVPELEF